MRRFTMLVVAGLCLAGLVTAVASAAHFTRQGAPTCTDVGTQLECTAELAGLGNEDLTMSISSGSFASVFCVSPGGNRSPGQNKTPGTVTGSTTIPGSAIKNGRARISAETDEPVTPSAQAAGCPNPRWTTELDDVGFTNITVTISQGGTLLFTCTRSGDPTTNNQTVPLTCTPA
jgi:hypothetical protein